MNDGMGIMVETISNTCPIFFVVAVVLQKRKSCGKTTNALVVKHKLFRFKVLVDLRWLSEYIGLQQTESALRQKN